MNDFHFQQGVLHAEAVALPDIAEAVGTPVYVYSRAHITRQYCTLIEAMSGVSATTSAGARICYAVKANSNLAILRCFVELGAGFDIVSGGELQRVIAAGGDPQKVVFSGVGKSTAEIDLALKLNIHCFNVESEAELTRISNRAQLLQRSARVSVRVNPNVDAATHPYISTGLKTSKFGVPAGAAHDMYRQAAAHSWLEPIGIACHIGSQIAEPAPMLEALDHLLTIIDELAESGLILTHIDLGGGFGVTYENEPAFDTAAYGQAVAEVLKGRELAVSIEPGRFLVANAGVLLASVEYTKSGQMPEDKNFAVIDAAMNDLIRPALYQAWHFVENVCSSGDEPIRTWDVVGPVCESGDFIARDRELSIAAGDLIAVHSAGAYAMVQASNYNSRGRPAEVLVHGDSYSLVRRRETSDDLMRLELI